jgi:predicted metalloendopeptidase
VTARELAPAEVDRLVRARGGIDAVIDPVSLAVAVGSLHAAGVDPFFGFDAGAGTAEGGRGVARIWAGGLSLPGREPYLADDERSARLREALRAHVERMFALSGVAPADARRVAGDVLSVESSLARGHPPGGAVAENGGACSRLDVAGLLETAPRFPWRRFLVAVGSPDSERFDVSSLRVVERLDFIVAGSRPELLRSYLRWKVLEALAEGRALPRSSVDERRAFTSRWGGGRSPSVRPPTAAPCDVR